VSEEIDIAVIGGGLTGLMAAHHAALAGVRVVHFIGTGLPGGLAANVGALDGFPAAAAPVSALDVALRLTEENDRLGVELVPEDIERITLAGDAKSLATTVGERRARTVIVATGARLRMLEAPGAERLLDRGVSQCAWCNGSLYRGGDVVVVGGGDAALQEALHLAEYARSITLVTRGARLRARQAYVARAGDSEKITFRWESEVAEVLGEDAVTGVRVKRRATGQTEEIACAGVFVYIGMAPNSGLLGELVGRDAAGFVVTDAGLATATPGIFAAGAVRSGYGGRLTHAMGEATAAALAACRSLGA
jgi:thioredoxin reductase (NADPH)